MKLSQLAALIEESPGPFMDPIATARCCLLLLLRGDELPDEADAQWLLRTWPDAGVWIASFTDQLAAVQDDMLRLGRRIVDDKIERLSAADSQELVRAVIVQRQLLNALLGVGQTKVPAAAGGQAVTADGGAESPAAP